MTTLKELGIIELEMRIGLDTYHPKVRVTQYDSGLTLEYDIIGRNGEVVTSLPDVAPVLYVESPDKQSIGSAEGTIEGGKAIVPIPSSLLSKFGEAEAQIQLVNSDTKEQIHDNTFILDIAQSKMDGEVSPGESLWFNLQDLKEAIASVHELEQQYDNDVSAVSSMRDDVTTKHGEVTDMHTSLQDVFDTESARVLAEKARADAEATRVSAEAIREDQETARVSAEQSRAEAETAREDTEQSREEAESDRVSVEGERVSAESTRESQEGERVSAETERANAEAERVSAESTRQTAETGRVDAESARIQKWQTWEGLIEEGVMPNATSTTAGVVRVETLDTESAPHTVPTVGKLEEKVDKVEGKGLSTNDYTEEAKAKVDAIPASPKYTDTITTINGKTGTITKSDITALGIPAQDTVYTHPSTHPASIITQDSTRRMVSDTQIAAWNGKVDKAGGQMTGSLVAQPSGNTRQARNIAIGTTAPTSTTGYSDGDIFLVVP